MKLECLEKQLRLVYLKHFLESAIVMGTDV